MPKPSSAVAVPPPNNWRTTDQDEIDRRRERARLENFQIVNQDPLHPIFSNFRVKSGSGLTYSVEIRDIANEQFACECVDFRINGLGTCKHVEAVLLHLQGRFKRLFISAKAKSSPRLDVVPDSSNGTLRVSRNGAALPKLLAEWFDKDGRLAHGTPEEALETLRTLDETVPGLRLSQELGPWLETRRQAAERRELRREYELKVQSGEWPAHETTVPLFPYQREGMLHLAFTERALLADEMGLGKTIQAIAACALLHRLGKASHVLVVTPASLKTEWEEQIQRFTTLPYQLVFGMRMRRLKAYDTAPFFTIVNYEQMLADSLDVNNRLKPDVVVLDEAQRIKNWSTKTTQAVKRLRSRYAFVLTGTPIENRIDEIYSLMDFLSPSLLGPLFRFNREYYELDDRGRPCGYRNLEQLHTRIKPLMLRRRKAEVETELPERTDRNHFVPLSSEQAQAYHDHANTVSRLMHLSKRRPLTKEEQEKLLRHLNMMRMVCDTNYILDAESRACPKIGELQKILEECRENTDVKVIIFSEWERMLELVRNLCKRLGMNHAWHTGSVPQRRRRAEIITFKTDPECRIFLSTDSGAAGLNLQNASVVINCDLPWNPAKLEQRIARAWRKHQTRSVTVMNLVSENTIEHGMLQTLSNKQALADGVLDHQGDLSKIRMQSGRQAFLSKLEQLVSTTPPHRAASPQKAALPADRPRGFASAAHQIINGAMVRCEERFPNDGPHSVLYVVVDRDAAQWTEKLRTLHEDYFGSGKWDPLSPVRLQIVDRATDEALQQMIELGIVAKTSRAARPLWPDDSAGGAPAPLSAQEQEKIARHRAHAARKLKMGQVLSSAGLEEEARAAVLEAVLPIGCTLAVQTRMPEPADLKQVFLPPLSGYWQNALEPLRAFVGDAAKPAGPVIELLQPLVAGS